MSASCHSLAVRRESIRPRYEDQDSAMYRALGAQGNFSDFRTSDVNGPLHDFSVYRERKHRSSHMLGYSPSRRQREGSNPCGGAITSRSGSSLELIPIDTKGPRGRKSKPHDESVQVQKSWVEIPRHLLLGTPEPLEPARSSISQRIREEAVRHSDDMYMDAVLSNRSLSTTGHQRDTPRRHLEDKLVRAPGNGDVTGEYRKAVPKRSRASERQRSYVPAAPIIPRLPTPDFDSASDYELGLAKYDFCPCCSSDGRDEDDSERWKKGKAKMDKQVDHARAYISQVTMSERLIAEA